MLTTNDTSISQLNDIMSAITISSHRNYCCDSYDIAITSECRYCLSHYLTIVTDQETHNNVIKRIVSENKTILFEVFCDHIFDGLISNDYCTIDYKSLYITLTNVNNVFKYINYITDLLLIDDNKELFTILHSYLVIWIKDFGDSEHNEYYEKCIDVFYDFFDGYISQLCTRLINECNTILLRSLLESYSIDIYEIDIANLLYESITNDKYTSFKFLYDYYTIEICEDTINLYTLANLYKVIFTHDRIDMFKLLYKLTKNCISRQTIVKLLKHNYYQKCSKAYTNGTLFRYKKIISLDDMLTV